MIDIPLSSLGLMLLLFLVPFTLSFFYDLRLSKSILVAVSRMLVQLMLIGVFLKYLIQLNNPFVNILWLIIMALSAVTTTLKSSAIKMKTFLIPTFASFFGATLLIVLYVNKVVLGIDSVFSARYLIVIGGMLLGNSLRSNILGVTTFYRTIKEEAKQYHYLLSLGAGKKEAQRPYLQKSLKLALKPSIATMGTLGLVSIPGMMTGVILGGLSPEVAVKYQIMIMTAILTSTSTSLTLTILFTSRTCFNSFGVLKENIFH